MIGESMQRDLQWLSRFEWEVDDQGSQAPVALTIRIDRRVFVERAATLGEAVALIRPKVEEALK